MKRIGNTLIMAGLAVVVYFGFLLVSTDHGPELIDTSRVDSVIHWESYFGILLVLIGSILLMLNANRKDEKILFTEDPAD